MRKTDYREFERPEISEWEENFEREGAMLSFAGYSCGRRRCWSCNLLAGWFPVGHVTTAAKLSLSAPVSSLRCYPYVSCSPVYVCHPSRW